MEACQLARRLGWSSQRTVRWLRRVGAATKVGSRWVTTPALLQHHFPDLAQASVVPYGETTSVPLPIYWTTGDVAKLLGWPTWKARRWLKRERARVRVAGRWVTTPRLLGAHFPDVFDALVTARGAQPTDGA